MPTRSRLNRCNNHPTTARPGNALAGCLIALAIVLVIIVAGGVFVALNAKNWAISGTAGITKLVIDESQLPAGEKPELKQIVDRLAGEVRAGTLSLEEGGKIIETVFEGPVFAIGLAQQIDNAYIQTSSLTDEQKEAGSIAVNRVAQGLASDSITWEQVQSALTPVANTTTTTQGGQATTQEFELRMPSEVTPEQINDAIDALKQLADTAGVPEERLEVDLSDELLKSIEATIGRELAPLPAG